MNSYDEDIRALSDTLIYELSKALGLSQERGLGKIVRPLFEKATKRFAKIGVELDRGVYTHHLYGNNVSATIGVVYDQLLKERELNPGDKILFGSAASGFTMVTLAGEWSE